jgi:hypothetical protein
MGLGSVPATMEMYHTAFMTESEALELVRTSSLDACSALSHNSNGTLRNAHRISATGPRRVRVYER